MKNYLPEEQYYRKNCDNDNGIVDCPGFFSAVIGL